MAQRKYIPPFNYIGLAHNICNLRAVSKFIVPVFIHNGGKSALFFKIMLMQNYSGVFQKFHSDKNKNVLGKFKDETANKIITK